MASRWTRLVEQEIDTAIRERSSPCRASPFDASRSVSRALWLAVAMRRWSSSSQALSAGVAQSRAVASIAVQKLLVPALPVRPVLGFRRDRGKPRWPFRDGKSSVHGARNVSSSQASRHCPAKACSPPLSRALADRRRGLPRRRQLDVGGPGQLIQAQSRAGACRV